MSPDKYVLTKSRQFDKWQILYKTKLNFTLISAKQLLKFDAVSILDYNNLNYIRHTSKAILISQINVILHSFQKLFENRGNLLI